MAQTIYCQKVIEKNTTHLVFKGLTPAVYYSDFAQQIIENASVSD